jgi:hypothetical protein
MAEGRLPGDDTTPTDSRMNELQEQGWGVLHDILYEGADGSDLPVAERYFEAIANSSGALDTNPTVYFNARIALASLRVFNLMSFRAVDKYTKQASQRDLNAIVAETLNGKFEDRDIEPQTEQKLCETILLNLLLGDSNNDRYGWPAPPIMHNFEGINLGTRTTAFQLYSSKRNQPSVPVFTQIDQILEPKKHRKVMTLGLGGVVLSSAKHGVPGVFEEAGTRGSAEDRRRFALDRLTEAIVARANGQEPDPDYDSLLELSTTHAARLISQERV